ncbi:TKL/LISK/LISK-DD1 protein kinase [Schizophyllum commune]
MHSDAFDVIPFEDIKGEWKKLGSGSFGNVYKGTYLGIDVAIKEVLPSTDYDVAKYFEREWRLMKETRHPNAVLFIGLSRAPEPDNRIFIVSEFVDGGNLRLYIHNKSKPFSWNIRISFATDIARALAYLHARRCIHRDLKGENLLITSNGRVKITDFGFARIAARNEEESKRLTFCGTDSYMSPEILLGDEFDLPTDIYSFGIILCEIAARKLADDHTFKRTPPTFGIDEDEVRKLASPGCPPDFVQLALDCLAFEPKARPTTKDILARLRVIEAGVLARPNEGEDVHVGSVKFATGGKRPGPGPRIPSFGMGVGKDIRNNGASSDDSDDDDLMEAISGLSTIGLNKLHTDSSCPGHEPLLAQHEKEGTDGTEYSTTVIRAHPHQPSDVPPSLSSILTIRPEDPNGTQRINLPEDDPLGNSDLDSAGSAIHAQNGTSVDPLGTSSLMSIATLDSYHTAAGGSSIIPGDASSMISSALATEGGSTIRSLHGNFDAPLVHRFTLHKPGARPKKSISGNVTPSTPTKAAAGTPTKGGAAAQLKGGEAWSPLDLFFSSGLLVAKCDVCQKRLGWKPVLECDDCGLRAHVKCGEIAPKDCGQRPARPLVHAISAAKGGKPASPQR